ncbi:MAG: hypothetical protein ACE37K_01825 [Planctomycetota bacterium]|jgi:glycerol uptake facilitator-like aquaporin
MPDTPSTTHTEQPLQQQGAVSTSTGTVTIHRGMLLRALGTMIVVLAIVGTGVGLLLFGGDELLEASALRYYVVGLVLAAAAMMLTIWVHGRFAATQMPGATSHAVSARLTGLLAAGMGVKMALLVLGFLALKQFPLSEEATKFSDITTFAVTFVGAALLCQTGTALILARALGRRIAG